MIPWHPFTVHFPLAWLLLAGISYTGRIKWPEHPLSQAAPYLHLGGCMALLVAIFSGRAALDDATQLSEAALAILDQHELGAYILLWGQAMLLIWVYVRIRRLGGLELGIFLLCFWGFIAGMMYQSHLGGEMVFLHGVGVQP